MMLVSITCRHSAGSCSRKARPRPWPALATSTSTCAAAGRVEQLVDALRRWRDRPRPTRTSTPSSLSARRGVDERRVGGDEQVVAVRGGELGELEADAARRAGDDGELTLAHIVLLACDSPLQAGLEDDLGVFVLVVVPVPVHVGAVLEAARGARSGRWCRACPRRSGRAAAGCISGRGSGRSSRVSPFSISAPIGNLSAMPP